MPSVLLRRCYSVGAIVEARGTAPRSMPTIAQRVYVRSSLIEVSGRWPVSGPLPDKPSRISPSAGRRDGQLAQICDTTAAAPGGLPQRQGAQPKLRSQSHVVVGFCDFFPSVLPGARGPGHATPSSRHMSSLVRPRRDQDNHPAAEVKRMLVLVSQICADVHSDAIGNISHAANHLPFASPAHSAYAWVIRDAATAAPNPLSTFTTVTPAAQLFSIASRAATPPKLAP